MFGLTGKTALVTGASGGIGGAIAEALVAAGARVVLSGTRRDVLQARAAVLGDAAVAVPGDLAAAGEAERLVAATVEALGRLDILVHNAGVARDGLAMRLSDEDWATVLDINLSSGFRLARAALRGMMRQRWGRIIAITSIVGSVGNAGQANYAASKAGTTAMIKSLAQEVASRGITANCVAPGFIETEMTAQLGDQRRQAILAAVPAGRFGRPEDVAPAVVFLASDAAAYVTGQTIHVNGGMAMV